MKVISFDGSFEGWRRVARDLLSEGVVPEEIIWKDERDEQKSLFSPAEVASSGSRVRIPSRFFELGARVGQHRDPNRWHVLYKVAFRIARGERMLLRVDTDPDVQRLMDMNHEVGQDMHRMTAFLRFRKIERDGTEFYIAWYRPDHDVLPLTTSFFVERFSAMKWSIFTPWRSAHWNGEELQFGAGANSRSMVEEDELEQLWREYYVSIFNPSRLNMKATQLRMPLRFWQTMPEAAAIPELVRGASNRVNRMIRDANESPTALPFVPDVQSIEELRNAARSCEGCELHRWATQTVFGEGAEGARMVLVGEQPGDVEDTKGRPFAGPAGQVLDDALSEAGIVRSEIYVTNAVKHFAFIERGKRRIHRTPKVVEVAACQPWLRAELRVIEPSVVVCLGATAAKAIIRPQFRLMQERGRMIDGPFRFGVIATIHPSAILRATDRHYSAHLYSLLVSDLKTAAGAYRRAG